MISDCLCLTYLRYKPRNLVPDDIPPGFVLCWGASLASH
jgi:hypothetical protein